MSHSSADFLKALYQSWSDRMAANPAMTMSDLRSLFDEWHKATIEPEGVCYRHEALGGVEVIWVIPTDADRAKVILYAHGGGFAVGSAASHRKLAGHLAKELGVTAVVVDYRRAPEHPYPAQIDDMTAVYTELLRRGFVAKNLATAGDSAGGNLAIATVLKLRQDGVALPGAVIAFSPWLDMEHTGGTLTSNAATDALVQKAILEGMSSMYLGDSVARTDPLANPLKADYRGFPRLYVNAGAVETLLDNATELARISSEAGVNTTLSVVPEMQHVFPCLAGRAIEADDEIRRIGKWFKAV